MLSPTQIEARRGKLTASRVAVLMKGDREGIMQLYLEMIGEAVEEDLSDVWPVRLGEATEALNLEWVERSGLSLSRRGEVVVHPKLSWAACTLDAWCDDLQCPIDAKHCGGREPLEVIMQRYSPQLMWQMECTGAEQGGLSVIMGANAPLLEFMPRDQAYIEEMIIRGKQFMSFVEQRIPPIVLPEVEAPVMAHKSYDMSEVQAWKDASDRWIQTFGAVQTAEDAEKVLKSLVPEDAKKAYGCGVRITRDRANRLSLREDKDEVA